MIWRVYPLAMGGAVSCLGYGFCLARLLGIAVNLGDAGILGLTCLAILGCAIHFVSALSTTVQIVTIGAGLALCVVFRGEFVRQCRGSFVSILVGLSAFFQRHTFTSYDNGLYHLQAVKWNSEFPITPGLANLHGRLGFNSVLYLIAPLDDRAGFGWVSGLLLLLFVLISCYARFTQARRNTVEFWFLGLAIALLALGAPGAQGWTGVLNADGFVAILTVYWVCIALSLDYRPQTNVPLLLLTGVLALTVKLSAAPLFLLALLAAWRHRKAAGVSLPKTAAAVAIFLGLWMARDVALSGCAVYPVPQTCRFDLPWAVSRAQAEFETLSIKAWARAPHRFDHAKVMSDWAWLGPWGLRTLQNWNVQFFLFGGLAGCVSVLAGARVTRLVAATFAGLCLCLGYWFLSAPDVRFGSGYLAAAGILGLGIACTAYFPDTATLRRLTLDAVAVSAFLGAAGLLQSGNSWTVKNPPAFVMRTAPGGKSIWVTQGDHEGSDQCWDHPLPCTPYFDSETLKRVRWR
jgi:uncharacterized MnhB-related membrane protein